AVGLLNLSRIAASGLVSARYVAMLLVITSQAKNTARVARIMILKRKNRPCTFIALGAEAFAVGALRRTKLHLDRSSFSTLNVLTFQAAARIGAEVLRASNEG